MSDQGSCTQLDVFGQAEALSLQTITVGDYLGLVTVEITGPDGTAYASLTPDRVDSLITMLRDSRRAAVGDNDAF